MLCLPPCASCTSQKSAVLQRTVPQGPRYTQQQSLLWHNMCYAYLPVHPALPKRVPSCKAPYLKDRDTRSSNHYCGITCAMLTSLCILHFPKECRLAKHRTSRTATLFPRKGSAFAELRHVWQKSPQHASHTAPEANYRSETHVLVRTWCTNQYKLMHCLRHLPQLRNSCVFVRVIRTRANIITRDFPITYYND